MKNKVISFFIIFLILAILIVIPSLSNKASIIGLIIYNSDEKTLILQNKDLLHDTSIDLIHNKNLSKLEELESKKDNIISYLEFNLDAIENDVNIKTASLCIFISQISEPVKLSTSKVKSDWKEDFDSSNHPCIEQNTCILDSETLVNENALKNWICLDVTNSIKDLTEIDKKTAFLTISSNNSQADVKFYSKEYTDSSLSPYLKISYQTANTAPLLTIDSPKNNEIYTEKINLSFAVSDSEENLDSCFYNLNDKENQSLANCESATISLEKGYYKLNIFAKDSSGLETKKSLYFEIKKENSLTQENIILNENQTFYEINESIKVLQDLNVEFFVKPDLSYKKGDVDKINFGVKNSGIFFLNKCTLQISEEINKLIKNNQEKGLSAGEKFDYILDLSIPQETSPNIYSGSIMLKCEEGIAKKEINIQIYRPSFDFNMISYERDSTSLKVTYLIEEFDNENKELILEYSLVDLDNVIRKSGQEPIVLGSGFSGNQILIFELPKDSFGEFILSLKLSDGQVEIKTEKEIFLPSKGLTGLAISEDNKKSISFYGVMIILLISSFAIFKFIFTYVKRIKWNSQETSEKPEGLQSDKLIKLDLDEEQTELIE